MRPGIEQATSLAAAAQVCLRQPMNFTILDWSAIVGYLLITLDPRPLLPPPLRQERGRLLSLRTQRELVAGRHLDGRDHLRRRHSAGRHRPGLLTGHRRQLALVVVPALRDDDRLPLRASVAALRPAHRRAVCRDALLRQARRVSPRISRHLPRPADELPHPRMGDEGHDHDRRHHARPDRPRRARRSACSS